MGNPTFFGLYMTVWYCKSHRRGTPFVLTVNRGLIDAG